MFLSLRKMFGHKFRSRRWVFFLLMGFIMMSFSLILVAIFTIFLAPVSIETIRSFHPFGVGLAAVSAFLISFFWLQTGFKTAFKILDSRDAGLSERLRQFVFRRKANSEHYKSIVALGGGTGLSSLLKGLKELPINLTAIVTVTDDGGSSGRLRKDLQILPPGDIRNCIVALSKSESLLSRLFQYRFAEGGDIEGHSFGNLFIAAMTGILGDFGSAVREASSILAIRGNVIPVTCDNVQLIAKFDDGSEIIGETSISSHGKRIVNMELNPSHPMANPEALSAIDDADIILLGPGSLYTSVIPNLLVPGVADKINESSAEVIYVCNIMTQPGETDSFSAVDHINSILTNTKLKKIDSVIVNSRRAAKPLVSAYEAKGQYWVPPTVRKIEEKGIRVIAGDLLLESNMVRHNPGLLANTVISLIDEIDDKVNQKDDEL